MGKRKRIFTAATYETRLAEGRGKGQGIKYIPWLKIHDISSYGLSHRIKSVWTTGRETHLFSNLERDWFFIFDWSKVVIDIQEQYPLLKLEETLAIAAECGIEHPVERRTKERHPIVFTTDQLITFKGDLRSYRGAYTIKYARMLSNKRVLEKFEIERRYWERRGVKLKILTEKDLPVGLARNIELIRGRVDISDRLPVTPERLYDLARVLTDQILLDKFPLRVVTSACDAQFGLPAGGALTVVYYLLANRFWEIDMYQRLNPGRRLTVLRHSIEALNPATKGAV